MSSMQSGINPEEMDRLFPIEQQRHYVSRLMKPTNRVVGLTRCRAEYFVRLWAYLLLKQQFTSGKTPQSPLKELSLPQGFIPCTHREAAAVFYAHKERGSDRAAGLILDKLVALGLINKTFDGNTICLQINTLSKLTRPLETDSTPKVEFATDAFNPRTDAILVASFLARNYNWMNNNTSAVPHRIARLLRKWAQFYGTGMRVLRRCDNLNPVGFYIFYPVAPESEKNFFLPPGKSLHLSSSREEDPIAIALPGNLDCTSVFIRSWTIDRVYMQPAQICQFLKDSQKTLVRMQGDFPNLCDMYALSIHPTTEKLALAVGFQKTSQDVTLGVCWLYEAVDRFLALDIDKALAGAEFTPRE
ncbi:hypothetical protein [Lusitaniella coriacea]|uniref:hypothetical protein n=1 Tax=Lusitaniella coriacea TaxID=1983105 RepID=UPI003CF9F886